MNLFEKTLSNSVIYSGKIFSIQASKIELSNGNTAFREVALKQHAACVLAITKSRKAILVKQFRYAIKKNLIEIPAGKLEKFEKNPLLCAKRELLEETGFKAPKWLNLGYILPSPGFCNEKIHIFLAQKAFKAANPEPDPDELLQTILVDFNKLIDAVTFGKITDAKTVCAVLKTQNLLAQHKLFL